MRKIAFFLIGTVAGLVALVSYRTSRGEALPVPAATAPPSPGPSGSPSASPLPSWPPGAHDVDGPVITTEFGTVQVRVVLDGPRLVDVVPLKVHDIHGHSLELNDYALPLLHDAVLAAQSAEVDTVTGATVTSQAYLTSLQAALDAAAR
ncbi:FMN-binding protein [Catellatospora tritici]|uniref:FMN-binding protein n=1 Tax=Catellatospora tritici TaxID=2851566 RepID=UPI001C2D67CB|nr:FMN-binding protein [Catellatospora tritici]MBV1850890.1 FMN-binding protein [Catellatospora tritici]MBV1851143.1 FMN-binding protein [Catellatospora tritici]